SGKVPVVVGNELGVAVQVLRRVAPGISRGEFDLEMGPGLDEVVSSIGDVANMHPQVRQIMADSKILCLTELPDNVAMWSYYAEQHQGVVLRFASALGIDSPWKEARPVEYVSTMPRFGDEE